MQTFCRSCRSHFAVSFFQTCTDNGVIEAVVVCGCVAAGIVGWTGLQACTGVSGYAHFRQPGSASRALAAVVMPCRDAVSRSDLLGNCACNPTSRRQSTVSGASEGGDEATRVDCPPHRIVCSLCCQAIPEVWSDGAVACIYSQNRHKWRYYEHYTIHNALLAILEATIS